ncbi:MAG: nuclear transport factor 2 family protein, partial [Planctomycetaceae bacterium]
GALGVTVVRGAEGDEQGVKEATAQFYTALNSLFTGDAAPMKQVWSHADDVTYMGPGGGMQVGWEQVSATWDKQAALKLGGKIESEQLRYFLGGEIAVVQNVEKGENEVNGKVEKVSIRATNVFRKEGGKWKMVSHHTDLLPFLQK